jgi:hypothetical protein
MNGGWVVLSPARGISNGLRKTAVMISIPAAGRRARRSVTISLRPELLDGVTWLTPGTGVEVALGIGAFLGRVRLSANGPMLLRAQSGKRVKMARGVSLALPELASKLALPSEAMKACCEVDWAPDWVEFALPDWARAATAATVTGKELASAIAERPPVATDAKGVPFLGVAQRTGVAGVPAAPLPIGPLTGGARR